MLEAVWRRASSSETIDRLVIATDDERIRAAGLAFGAEVEMTAEDHPSGTDRCAEVLSRCDGRFDVVLVIQGDEPMITSASLDGLVTALRESGAGMATLAEPIESVDELFNPNVVKLVRNDRGDAMYFSRSPIPYYRGDASRLDVDFRQQIAQREGLAGYRKHQGIYAYTAQTMAQLTALPPAPIELDEGLEQLRALAAGVAIRVIDSDFKSFSVDTPEDLQRVEALLTEAN